MRFITGWHTKKLKLLLAGGNPLFISLAVVSSIGMISGPFGAWLAVFVAIGVYAAMGSGAVSWALMRPLLIHVGKNQVGGTPSTIVVLAGDADRLVAFRELADRWPDARLIFSGGRGPTVNGRVHLATICKPLIDQMGIGDRVFYETDSRNTRENAERLADLLIPDESLQVVIVTSAWHMRRALNAVARTGIRAVPHCVMDRVSERPVTRAQAFRQSQRALREWLSLICYGAADWCRAPSGSSVGWV